LRGIVLSLERMQRVLDIDPKGRWATAEPGIITSEFKRQVRAAGLFYPPDPTSEEECTLGGTVACNASGSRTYRYGPTRPYVRALRVVMADGRVQEVRRISANKNATGYFGLQSPTDLWVGSEGTLGIITQVELDLLPPPPGYFGAMVFFTGLHDALRFVIDSDTARAARRLQPRCLELFDEGSLELIRPQAGGLRIPAEARAAIYFEEEADPEEVVDSLERWMEGIEAAGGLVDETIVAQTDAEQQELRRLRHALPAGMNERGARAALQGGRKVSTDFAVPLPLLPEMMERGYATVRELFGGFFVAYGHVGNGHPHFNLLAEDEAGLGRARAAALRLARIALDLGGTLAAEHGLGKLKVPLYRELYPSWMYEAMRSIKRQIDPKGILAPGNLFEDEGGGPGLQ